MEPFLLLFKILFDGGGAQAVGELEREKLSRLMWDSIPLPWDYNLS